MMDKKDKEELEKQLLALFIFVMKYNKKLSYILSSYKSYKNELLLEIDKIYKKYNKDDKLQMTPYELNSEVKKLSDKMLKLSRDLCKQEKEILPLILYLVCDTTYKQTYNILIKDTKDLKGMNKGVKDDIIYKKIKGKDNLQRIKENKTIFYNRTNKNIKESLKNGNSIEQTKEIIEDIFINEEKRDKRLVNNEIARTFNTTTMLIYEKEGVKKVEWVASLEKNTCSECASLDGQVFNIEDAPIPILDTHANCHCILIPVE